MKKLTNKQKFELLWNEVKDWNKGNDSYDSLNFCVVNGLQSWAVYEWIGSGASQYDFDVKIPKKDLDSDLKDLWDLADTFTCPSCNYVMFLDKGLNDYMWCDSCICTNVQKDIAVKDNKLNRILFDNTDVRLVK